METTPPSIRIVVADDHSVVRAGICRWLDREPDLDVVGEAQSGQDVLRLVALHRPDVVLSDIRMPDMDGLALARTMQARHPEVRMVLMTSHKGRHVREILDMGTVGYLTKEAEREMFVVAVRWAAQGRYWLDPTELRVEMTRHQELRDLGLTPTEQRILGLINRPNESICEELGMKASTLRKTHLSNIYFKLQVNKRQEAIDWARKRKLLVHDDA